MIHRTPTLRHRRRNNSHPNKGYEQARGSLSCLMKCSTFLYKWTKYYVSNEILRENITGLLRGVITITCRRVLTDIIKKLRWFNKTRLFKKSHSLQVFGLPEMEISSGFTESLVAEPGEVRTEHHPLPTINHQGPTGHKGTIVIDFLYLALKKF